MKKQESGQCSQTVRGISLMRAASRARQALIWAVAVSVLLLIVPHWLPALAWLAWPQVLAGTLVHELGHGLTAMVTGGSFESLKLYLDGSGVAYTRSPDSDWLRAAIAAGGLFGPPLAGAALFAAACDARMARATLALISLLLLLAMLLWVRNGFGWVWVALCMASTGWVAWRTSALANQAFTCFLAVQACLASFARSDYLFAATATTGAGEMASDTAQIGALLGGPHWFWGGLLWLLSLATILMGGWMFLRALRLDSSLDAK
ncbi:MAG TPA: M50 family metallopeptidase [Chiayiivirga sp.]|nr:M50 family metallopeptidase [Chiayiivirga sp.]